MLLVFRPNKTMTRKKRNEGEMIKMLLAFQPPVTMTRASPMLQRRIFEKKKMIMSGLNTWDNLIYNELDSRRNTIGLRK